MAAVATTSRVRRRYDGRCAAARVGTATSAREGRATPSSSSPAATRATIRCTVTGLRSGLQGRLEHWRGGEACDRESERAMRSTCGSLWPSCRAARSKEEGRRTEHVVADQVCVVEILHRVIYAHGGATAPASSSTTTAAASASVATGGGRVGV